MRSSHTRILSLGRIHSSFLGFWEKSDHLLSCTWVSLSIWLTKMISAVHRPTFHWWLVGLQTSSFTIFLSSRIQHVSLTEVARRNNWHKGEMQNLAHRSQFSLFITILPGSNSNLWILPFLMQSPLNKEGENNLNTISLLVWLSIVNEMHQSSSLSVSFQPCKDNWWKP